MDKKCIECGELFNAYRKNHNFCSKKCSNNNWKRSNLEHVREKEKKYREIHKEKQAVNTARWRENNKERIKINKHQYYLKNKKRFLERRKNNLQERLKHSLRSRLHSAIKYNTHKAGSAVKDLGCTLEELRIHLESKWQEGMNWDNYGLRGWHIDHIKPLDDFDLEKREELLKACHYTNLQPLWAKDNLAKNNKV